MKSVVVLVVALLCALVVAKEEGVLFCPTSDVITAPASDDRLSEGFSYTVSWDAEKIGGNSVRIELWEYDAFADELEQVVADSTANDGSFEMTVPYVSVVSVSGEFQQFEQYYLYFTNDEGDTFSSSCFSIIEDFSMRAVAADDIAFFIGKGNAEEFEVEVRESSTQEPQLRTSADMPNSGLDGMVSEREFQPSTDYDIRYRRTVQFADGLKQSSWSPWVAEFTTQVESDCSDNVVAAYFSQLTYYDWQEGQTFEWCGDWEVYFVYNVGVDHVFVLKDSANDRVVVSHRGTEADSLEDIADNIGILIACPDIECSVDAAVSSSYLDAYFDADSEGTIEALEELRDDGYDRVIFTGHSQGGAISTITAFDIFNYITSFDHVALITFGSPKIANQQFVDDLYAKLDYSARFVQDSFGESDLIADLGPPFSEHIDDKEELPCDCPSLCHCTSGYTKSTFLEFREGRSNAPPSPLISSLLQPSTASMVSSSVFAIVVLLFIQLY